MHTILIRFAYLASLLCSLSSALAAPSIVALDVGHFLAKPGAMSAHGRTELSFNQALAPIVASALAQQGIQTVLIGEQGDMAILSERTRRAAQANAQFFLSLHHDSAQAQFIEPWQWQGATQHYSDRFSGFSLFVSRKNPDLVKSLRCASAIGAALIAQGFHPTEHHAAPIAGENKAWADKAHGVYYFDDLIVLKTASMPAVLLESGVIVNREEDLRLAQPETQQAIAQAVSSGLVACHLADRSDLVLPRPIHTADSTRTTLHYMQE